MSAIRRLYVRKKEGFRQGEESLTSQLNEVLGNRLAETAVYHRYDVDGLTEEDYEKAVATVFSEPPVDSVEEALPKGDLVIGVEFLCQASMTREQIPLNSALPSLPAKTAHAYAARSFIHSMAISLKATVKRS